MPPALLAFTVGVSARDSPARVTILYDAIGKSAGLKLGWGYSAFIDHTSGLHHVLNVNPGVKIYAPVEQQNFHTPSAPGLVNMIKRRVDSAPEDMHYFDGKVPQQVGSDSPWPNANFAQIRTPTEVLPGFWLFSTVSDVTRHEGDERGLDGSQNAAGAGSHRRLLASGHREACRGRKMTIRLLAVLLLTAMHPALGDAGRYAEIARLIERNRHLSAHLVMAVDARTIKAVRTRVTGKDIPVLVQMMGDKDYGVASAAAGLLVTLGKPAAPALAEAARGKNTRAAIHAQGALRLLEDCYNEALRSTMNPDVCPAGG
jgi:hypothetical protein